ncbi:hypothetical protein CL617_02365 [archaeon]|nr:hypothetical protein [archaeon]|tara:strand:- start:16878 stop:17366 length:489 start_codon:yes stop_codon:yes gene_type:complete
MAEFDYVVFPLRVFHDDILDTGEVFRLIQDWLTSRDYSLYEQEYHVDARTENNVKIFWRAEKKVDDYAQFVIEVRITGSNIHETTVKNKKFLRGAFNITFESYIESDYEQRWEQKPFLKVWRGLYDKLFIKDKLDRYNDELKNDTYNIYDEIKAFLSLKKFN